MNKKQLANVLAKISRCSPAQAADEIDDLVYRLLKDLKRQFSRKPRHRSAAALAAEDQKNAGH